MSAEKFGTKELYYTPAPTLVVSCGERDRTHTHITPNKCRRFGSCKKFFARLRDFPSSYGLEIWTHLPLEIHDSVAILGNSKGRLEPCLKANQIGRSQNKDDSLTAVYYSATQWMDGFGPCTQSQSRGGGFDPRHCTNFFKNVFKLLGSVDTVNFNVY